MRWRITLLLDDRFGVHVGLQRRWDAHGAVLLLKVFENREQRAADPSRAGSTWYLGKDATVRWDVIREHGVDRRHWQHPAGFNQEICGFRRHLRARRART